MTAMRTALVIVNLICASLLVLARPAHSQEHVEFTRHIQPILQQSCTKCHGGVRREAGLSLLAPGGVGESGNNLVVAGKPDESELLRRVVASNPDERMPADGPPLSPDQISNLRQWIEAGAVWPSHWSYAPLKAPQPPEVADVIWCRTAIDSFVMARLKRASFAPSVEANRYTLIRRVSLDLLGLAPAVDAADAFATDQAPDAYERLVDRLLASPHFGERWGRHWLDQARYADSDGYEVDKPRPDAYRWRDWVIDAVNRDLPLDQFTIEQFAGDLLPNATPQQQLATAYHRQTLTNNEGGVDQEEYRFKAVQDRASNTASVWLGLTLGCAQCHDHPYDPFTQREFFALSAIFNNSDEAEIELPEASDHDSKPKKFRVLASRKEPRTTRLLKRGEFLQPGVEVEAGVLSGLHPLERHHADALPDRLDLARWLVNPANPLTPRVIANQVWLKLFGQGLVRTPDDFGARGEAPTHPELLDWLAVELLSRGASRKSLIRAIVSSATYRQASNQRPRLAELDPENRLLWRQNRIRVEAEIVRDLHIEAAGLLDQRIGGPSVYPPLDPEFVKITFRSQLPWKTSTGGDCYRRGLYTFFKRSVPYPDLMLFDCPDAASATHQRSVTNTPLQALASLNSETSLDAARGLARRMHAERSKHSGDFLNSTLRICLTRPATKSELARLAELHRAHQAWYAEHPDDARELAGESSPDYAACVATANVILNLDELITRE
jgi:mono/diheme cytochrome c family protein